MGVMPCDWGMLTVVLQGASAREGQSDLGCSAIKEGESAPAAFEDPSSLTATMPAPLVCLAFFPMLWQFVHKRAGYQDHRNDHHSGHNR